MKLCIKLEIRCDLYLYVRNMGYTINVGKSIIDEGIEKHEIPIDEEGEKWGIPGFEAVFAIAGLLAVTYFLRRRNDHEPNR